MTRTSSSAFRWSLIIRIVLVFWGEWQDKYMSVTYSDLDYDVFTDASRAIANGETPFRRATYRYTPLLAFALLPNVWWFHGFGKLVFVAIDILVGWLCERILLLRGVSRNTAKWCMCTWLLNPMAVNVSTRGNADSLVCALALATVYLLMKGRDIQASLIFGLAVHVKIYPIIYALPFVLFINDDFPGGKGASLVDALPRGSRPTRGSLVHSVLDFFSWKRVRFGLISGSTFIILIVVFYAAYGWQFLYETYLYHAVRTDNRHNFSVYFYDLYLRYELESRTLTGLVTFLPQFSTLVLLGTKYAKDLPFALLTQTIAFVMFNKVCTAQYFLWFMAIMPVVLPFCKLSFKWGWLPIIVWWFASEFHWLYWAFQLETLGHNTFLEVWLAGIIFFVANVYAMVALLRAHIYTPVFIKGKLLDTAPIVLKESGGYSRGRVDSSTEDEL